MARPMPREAPVIRTARPLIRSWPARRLRRAARGNGRLGAVVRRYGPGDDLAIDPVPPSDRFGLAGLPAPDGRVRVQAGLVVLANFGDEVAGLGEAEARCPADRLSVLGRDGGQRNAGRAVRAGQGDAEQLLIKALEDHDLAIAAAHVVLAVHVLVSDE